ncbi:nucleotidyltransferase [Halanaerobacter jeridensis]|uniref:tRNA(Met) cytidine acetate ligase n=1 Tax=Halanaerobacter jeridensis TaxID=706427 RepID=A0A938XTG3_9FIRM|nr:nucleotidyltransferase [Halanaerobacter jeridensis]MBM7556579.1 putative nucleotidyltransferase [Halanaerobacter jeridensis]
MKILGIITEYNPFHNGHQIHLQESIAESGADASICIMSGSFLQRGTPALINQWARTEMALEQGVNLVIQLPISYSIRSAEHFAFGSVKLLDATNIVDSLCFGSESGKIQPLQFLGQLLAQEPPQLSELIQKKLESNLSYPQARAAAVGEYLQKQNTEIDLSQHQIAEILHNSNNILGIEYIKALTKLNSSIKPLTIQRQGADYNTQHLEQVSSATAIRKQIKKYQENNDPLITDQLQETMPATTVNILEKEFTAGRGPIYPQDLSNPLLAILRRNSRAKFKNYEDVRGGLENRIKDAALNSSSWVELINKIKTKRFTQTRIQRILAQILLNLKENSLREFDQAGGPLYFRILGFNQQGKELLHKIKSQGDLPLISRVANHFKSNYQPQNLLQKMLSFDVQATNIYNLAYPNHKWKPGNSDYKQAPIIKA